jgi:hypothetical protein
LSDPTKAVVSGDRVQPRLHLARVPERSHLLGSDEKALLDGISCFFSVAQHGIAEVEEAIGVAVVDGGQGGTIAIGYSDGQFTVFNQGHSSTLLVSRVPAAVGAR